MRTIIAIALTLISLVPGAVFAQEGEPLSDWQVEKCQTYRQSWEKALDFFGSDNINYNFIAQNENFIASGCTARSAVCAQSSQELDIANALTIAMMNAGAASTFLPFRCEESATPKPISGAAPDSELCRSQLELLNAGEKLTPGEAAVFETQCACLEANEKNGTKTECAG